MAEMRFSAFSQLIARHARLLLALTALALAGIAGTAWQSAELDRDLLLARVRFAGLPSRFQGSLAFQLAREADSGERRLAAARMLFGNRAAMEEKRTDSVGERTHRLEGAEALASEAIVLLPASWEASMILGASRFERQLVNRDTRLFTGASKWELPLSAAVARSQRGTVAEQTLAAGYLEVYPALSTERRGQVAQVIRNAFTDRSFRTRYLDRWLSVAGSLPNAQQLLPNESDVLQALAMTAWRSRDTDAALRYWGQFRRQRLNAVRATVKRAVEHPEELIAGPAAAYTFILENAPVDQESVPEVEEALRRFVPRTFVSARLTEAALRWLAWAQPLCLMSTCPLAPDSFDKLATLAAQRLTSEVTAFAALASGDVPRAEKIARENGALASDAWSNYLLLAAKGHLARKEPGRAALLLQRVHPNGRERPLWAVLHGQTGFSQSADDLARLHLTSWSSAGWTRTMGWSSLELASGRHGRALRVELRQAGADPIPLVVEWDGIRREPIVVPAGAREFSLDLDVAPGLHLLRLSVLTGKLPAFGATALD